MVCYFIVLFLCLSISEGSVDEPPLKPDSLYIQEKQTGFNSLEASVAQYYYYIDGCIHFYLCRSIGQWASHHLGWGSILSEQNLHLSCLVPIFGAGLKVGFHIFSPGSHLLSEKRSIQWDFQNCFCFYFILFFGRLYICLTCMYCCIYIIFTPFVKGCELAFWHVLYVRLRI